jgi:hypothetical protein
MLEALVLSLGLMDQSYFLKEDLREKFMALLEGLRDQPVVILIGTPSICDIAHYHELPFYAAYKWTKGGTVRPFPPANFGHIILSSTESDEIRILPLVDNSHKMPMPGAPKKSPPPPGTNLNKLTVSYDAVWNKLAAEQFGWAGGKVVFAVVCGPALSNICSVSLVNYQHPATAAATVSSAKVPDYYFVKTPLSPPLPDKTGINIAIPEKQKIVPGKPFALYGSFALPGSTGKDVLIHLLFTQPSTPGISDYTVTIPHEALIINNGTAKGHFLFDVMGTMYWKPGERFDVPESLYVSAVCRGVFSGPKLFGFIQEKTD